MNVLKALPFKISAVFIGFIVVFFYILFYHNLYAMDMIRTQVSETHMNTFALYGMKVDDSLDEVRNYLIRTLHSNDDIADIAEFNSNSKGGPKYLSGMVKVQRKLGKDILYYNIVDGLFVYSHPHDEMITFFADPGITEGQLRDLLKHAVKDKSSQPGLGWHVDYLVDEYNLVYFVNLDDDSMIGALVSLKRLLALSDFEKSVDSVGMIVISEDGEVLLSTGDAIPAAEIAASMADRSSSGYRRFRDSATGDKYIVVANKTVRTNLWFVEVFDENSLYEKLRIFQTMILLIPVGVIVTLIIYFVFLQRILISPMGEIKKGINNVIMGHLNFRLEEKGTSEFKMIIRVFNDMVSQIQDLKINIYEERLNLKNEELHKKKAELSNMQLRINPHFYANSLNIIYNLAAIKNYAIIQEMAVLLSRYFRYMMETTEDLVELSKEIDLIKDYLGIQKLRFTKWFEYELEVDERLLPCKVPSLAIQPFVENSIIHGFLANTVLRIGMTAKLVDDEGARFVDIVIRDNGKGFAVTDLSDYIDPQGAGHDEHRHIGIANVHTRLSIIYGPLAGIRLYNHEDGGAAVHIRFPANG